MEKALAAYFLKIQHITSAQRDAPQWAVSAFFRVVSSFKIVLSRANAYSSNSTEFESVIFDLSFLVKSDKRIYWKDSEMFHYLNMGWNNLNNMKLGLIDL